MKTCSGCGQEKLLTDFHKWRHSKDGHRARCKACRKPESQQYHQEHKEEIAAYHAKWFEGNKERERRRKMAWRHKNKPKVQARARRARARHHEARRQYINTWRKLNPARYRLQKYRRRCAEAQGIITEAQWVDALFWFGYRCLACGSTDAKLCIDHVIPLSRGGANSIANCGVAGQLGAIAMSEPYTMLPNWLIDAMPGLSEAALRYGRYEVRNGK